MTTFRKRQAANGPKIALTEKQTLKLTKSLQIAGYDCLVHNHWTGSCYVTIYRSSDDEMVANIRLSGHEPGRRSDYTHDAVGKKSFCLAALKRWIVEIVGETQAVKI